MTNSTVTYTRDDFISCNWTYDVLPENHYGYITVMQCLDESAKEKSELGFKEQSSVLNLLSKVTSMMMAPESLNSPFKPYYENYQSRQRSPLPEDLTTAELAFLTEILDDIEDSILKSRVADLLWFCKSPRSPTHAKIAIDLYTSKDINSETWNRGEKECWERAARLCMQLRDFERLAGIKNKLFASFNLEHSNNKFMTYWIASLMDKLKIDADFNKDIATLLFQKGTELLILKDFYSARSYFELSSKKFKQFNDNKGWLDSLINLAASFEQEADSRISNSNMVANSFYEDAIQAFRRIPTRFRAEYKVDEKISAIRSKITSSGKESLEEMGVFEASATDISESIIASKNHVSEKSSFQEGLIYFAGLYPGPKHDSLKASAQEVLKDSIISNLMGSNHMSTDGRVIAKTPPMNLSAGEDDPNNQTVLNRQILQLFTVEVQLFVEGSILPAVQQLILEHRISREYLTALCRYAPIIPKHREHLVSTALWLGFEHDFGSSIHLLCPQVEHIVRTKLKEVGAITSNLSREGLENENGLSSLLELPEAETVFGVDLCFELKSIFTDSIGSNLRNEVAHGLLDDDSSFSPSSVYAWWMVIRLIVRSMCSASSSKVNDKPNNSSCTQNT